MNTNLADLGLADATNEHLMIAAKATCSPADTMINMPFEVTPEMICVELTNCPKQLTNTY